MKARDSKYGKALVLETSDFSGGYILGFRVEKLDEAYTEISNLFRTYSQNPQFGVEVTFDESGEGQSEPAVIPKVEDNVEIVDTGYTGMSLPVARKNYAVGGDGGKQSEIVFSEELGLAVEKPANGMSIEQLWKII